MLDHDGPIPNTTGKKLTYDDYARFPEDRLRHELIDGEHYVTPSFGTKHQMILVNLVYRIEGWLRRNPIGELLVAPLDVLFSRPLELLTCEGDVLRTPLLPGLELPLAQIFDTHDISFPAWYRIP